MISEVLLFFLGFNASAAKPSQEQAQKQIENKDGEYRKVLGTLYQANQKIRRTVVEKSKLEEERNFIETQVKMISEKISSIEAEQKTKRRVLLEKISFIGRFHSQAWLNYLLSAKNSAHFDRNLKLLGILSAHDSELIQSYSENVKSLAQQRVKFSRRLEKIKNLSVEITGRENQLRDEGQQRRILLDRIRKSQSQLLERFRKSAKANPQNQLAESGILDAIDSRFLDNKGNLSSPVDGVLKKTFGIYRDTNDRTIFNHKGHFYQSVLGRSVETVAAGRVVHVGELREMGHVVVIDHGDHFFTVYSGMSNVSVVIDQELLSRAPIGNSGFLGLHDQVGIYFEIRHFSESIDPKAWMKGQSYEISDNRQ